MDGKIKLNIDGIGELLIEKGTNLRDLARSVFEDNYKNYLGAKINNEVFNLSKTAEEDMNIRFIDINDVDGYRIYTKTISAVFIMACKELFPDRTVRIEHFLGEGLYVTFEKGHSVTFKVVEQIQEKMQKIIRNT